MLDAQERRKVYDFGAYLGITDPVVAMHATQAYGGTLFIAFSTKKQPYILRPIEAKDFNLDADVVKKQLKPIRYTPEDVAIKKILVVRYLLSIPAVDDIYLQCDHTYEEFPDIGIVYTTGTSENVKE